jgi:hypothetical protein
MTGANEPQCQDLRDPQRIRGEGSAEWFPTLRAKQRVHLSGSWAGFDPITFPHAFIEQPTCAEPIRTATRHPALSRRGTRFLPLTLSEMADLPPPEWLIDGLVPQDGLVVLYGEPAAGKSFVALDWGLSVATGAPWLVHDVKQGEVVYIYAEGVRGLKRRAEAWFQEHGKTEAPLFRAVSVGVEMPNAAERGEFLKAVRSVSKQPRLIIIDTLARNFGPGNESLAQDMNAFVAGCDHLKAEFPGVTVLVVHHSGKDQTKGARGSLALQGATDAVFAVTRADDTLRLKNEKQKDGEEAVPISLELARVQLPDGNTSRVVRGKGSTALGALAAGQPRKDPRIVKTDAGSLKALAEFGPEGATLSQWERAVDRANDTFYKSRDRLVEAGKVRFHNETAHYVVVESGGGPGPGLVQNGSKSIEVQEVSPVIPL